MKLYSNILITSILIIFLFCFYENIAKKNIIQCEKIKIGMSVEQVIKIMGKPQKTKMYFTKINYKEINVIDYYYSAPSTSAVGVNIYFNNFNKKVIKKECTE